MLRHTRGYRSRRCDGGRGKKCWLIFALNFFPRTPDVTFFGKGLYARGFNGIFCFLFFFPPHFLLAHWFMLANFFTPRQTGRGSFDASAARPHSCARFAYGNIARGVTIVAITTCPGTGILTVHYTREVFISPLLPDAYQSDTTNNDKSLGPGIRFCRNVTRTIQISRSQSTPKKSCDATRFTSTTFCRPASIIETCRTVHLCPESLWDIIDYSLQIWSYRKNWSLGSSRQKLLGGLWEV